MLENRTIGGINMGRYPFTECLNEYLPSEEGHLEPITMKSFTRRLRQIGDIFHELKESGQVSTDNRKKITPDDIDRFVGYRKKNGIKPSTVHKDLGNLEKFLTYYDNQAVSKFRRKYPAHVPKRYHNRGPSMDEDVTQAIFARGMEISIRNWELMEAYGVVTVAICAGFRPKELCMLSISNVSIKENGVVSEDTIAAAAQLGHWEFTPQASLQGLKDDIGLLFGE